MELSSIIAIGSAAIASPFLAFIGSLLIDYGKSLGALLRITRDPLYDKSSVLGSVRRGSVLLIGRCYVHSITRGRIEVRSTDGMEAASWSIRDFEKLDKISEVK